MEDRRPVEVLTAKSTSVFNGTESVPKPSQYSKGLFHCWEHHKDGEDFSRVYALVEMQDGKVKRFEIEEVKFLDSVDYQKSYIDNLFKEK